jgi:DNA-binding IclR family transcriptional regulator
MAEKEKPSLKTDFNATEKVLKILTAFLPFNEPKGTLEIARTLGIHRASISRILGILKKHDFVQQDEKTKLYRLGSAAAVLGKSVNRSFQTRFVSVVQPYMHQLSEEIQESVSLVTLADNQVILPYRVKGPHPISVAFTHGDRGAINANSGAKAIMAFLSSERMSEVKKFYPKLPSFTSNTMTTWEALTEQFDEIRQSGFGYDLGEYNLDIFSVGAPILDYNNDPIGAITILVPSFRAEVIKDRQVLFKLKKATTNISEALMNGSSSSRNLKQKKPLLKAESTTSQKETPNTMSRRGRIEHKVVGLDD